MKNALILHGTSNTVHDNWFPWLKEELVKKGYKAWIPSLPGADRPNIERYNNFIFPKWKFDKESVLIGHSSGAVAILGILENLPEGVVIERAIFVAGLKDNEDLKWEALDELFTKPFEWEKIKSHCKKFIILHSDNDPYATLSHAQHLAEKLKGDLVIFKDQKHFSVTTMGEVYRRFPQILEYLP